MESAGCLAWTGITCAGQANRWVQMPVVLDVDCLGWTLDQKFMELAVSFVFWLNASQMLLFHLVFLHWLFPSTALQLGPNLAADAPSGAGRAGCRNGQNQQLPEVAKDCSPVQQWLSVPKPSRSSSSESPLCPAVLSQYCSSFSRTQGAKAHTKRFWEIIIYSPSQHICLIKITSLNSPGLSSLLLATCHFLFIFIFISHSVLKWCAVKHLFTQIREGDSFPPWPHALSSFQDLIKMILKEANQLTDTLQDALFTYTCTHNYLQVSHYCFSLSVSKCC